MKNHRTASPLLADREPSGIRAPNSVHVITGLWKHTGGPAESVPALCVALQEAGSPTTIATLDGDMAPGVTRARTAGVDVRIFQPTFKHSVWYSRSFAVASPQLVMSHDVVHVHGLWQFVDWKACADAQTWNRPLVISPRGSLMRKRLQRSAWKKRVAGMLFDRRNITQATLMHATSEHEAEEIWHYGYKGPIAVIPNGIAIPDDVCEERTASDSERFYARWNHLRGQRLMLFLSRVQPIKGLSSLVEAWATLAAHHPDWHLVVAGPDERGHTMEISALAERRGLSGRVTFTGPLYDSDRTAAFAASEFLILPTMSENFGMVIAESLAHSRPVFTTFGAPWSQLPNRNCGWWVPIGADAMITALPAVLSMTRAQMRSMGNLGRQWMSESFSWSAVATSFSQSYRWITGSATDTPDCIRFPH